MRREQEAVTFDEAYRQLQGDLAANTPASKRTPKFLKLKDIRESPVVFQPRVIEDFATSEGHIRTLMDAALGEPHNQLDAITVWWSGISWIILDGHHRYEAYKRLSYKKLATPLIPVSAFKGTLPEAVLQSTKLNSKDKLPMSKDDKLNRAWRMVIIGSDFSKRLIADACKVGIASVGRMRNKLNQIREAKPDEWSKLVSDMTWKEAQGFGQCERLIDDEWQERIAREWARRLAKTFGKKPSSQPETMWRALELYSPRLAANIEEHLRPRDLENDDF